MGSLLVAATGASVAAAAPAPVPIASSAPHVGAPEAGLRTATSTTYRLDPAGGAVHVSVRITLTNNQPDVAVAGGVRQFFLDRFGAPVLGEAEGFVASRDGTPLTVRRVPTPGAPIATASIDLVPNLFYGQTQVVELSYRLPSLPPRGDGFSRVNAAFVTFPAFAAGDPGDVDIEVVVPKGLEVELVGDPMERSEEGDVVVYRAFGIADPETFLTNIVARDDAALVKVPVTFGEHELTVLGWPGDGEWAEFVAVKVERGVPALEDLIGLPWPGTDDLEVIETASPYLYGYAGWYSPSESLVEIGDELDGVVILHELSHLWFNHDLFVERWINEGFAEEYAALALGRLGEEAAPPEAVDPADPGRIPLLDWSSPDLQEPISDAQESYGYNASYAVLDRIAKEIGDDALSKVIVAADERAVPYVGDGEPLRYPGAPGWRELLDLLEDVGGSTTAAATFADLVVTDAVRPSMDDRTAARTQYDELLGEGGGWTAPRGVRRAMAKWQFDTAGTLIAAARDALAVRAEVTDVLARVDLDVPDALEDGYEGAMDEGDLEDATDGVVEASEAVAGAVVARRTASGPLVALGTLGGGAAGRLADARSALAGGDYDEAAADAGAATDAYEGAAMAGALRLAAALLVLIAVVVITRRNRRRGGAPPQAQATNVSEP